MIVSTLRKGANCRSGRDIGIYNEMTLYKRRMPYKFPQCFALLSISVLFLFLAGASIAQQITTTIEPRSHGLVRGWARVANGTLVAENGSLLRGACVHTINQTYFSQWYGSLSWWQKLHDVGHFNVVKAGAYLGQWNNSTDPEQKMTILGIESVLDTFVANASRSGMYVVIIFDTFSDPTDWGSITEFWTAIAPRYANNTNVIYEIGNELDNSTPTQTELASNYQSLYQMIRSAAPNTPIILWSLSNPVSDDTSYGLVNLFRLASDINYSNAVVGYHPYCFAAPCSSNTTTMGQQITEVMRNVQNAGYPIMMTEYSIQTTTPPYSWLHPGLWNAGISWIWLDADGFNNADNGVNYGNANIPISVQWPED